MQDQLVCRGCRNRLMYRRGATDVCCSLCNTINSVHSYHPHPIPPQGMDMAHIRCGGCQTMLMYTRGDARSVRCSCCQTLNNVSVPTAAPPSNQTPHVNNQTAHINCGHCRTTLMYPYGAPSVKCAVCQYVTNVNMNNGRVPQSMNRPNGTVPPPTMPSPSSTQTVVVENPMSMDESGKLVSNVVVGVTTAKK